MKTCFISMPLGTRRHPYSEQQIDFDAVFAKLIAPAASAADVTLLRWDNASGPVTQRDALRAIISSDVLLADVSTLNPNVMYELGIRHAANRGPTIIVAVEGERLPFYIAYIPAFFYNPQNPEAMQSQVATALRNAARRSDGSPVYEFFPELHVELPPELKSEERQMRQKRASEKRAYDTRFSPTHQPTSFRTLRKAGEAAIRIAAESEPTAFIDMLKSYRDAGDWESVIRAGQSPPEGLEKDPRVMQLVAFALAQRGREGDEEHALAMMRKLAAESGADAETLGIMGRIYKNRYKRSRGEDHESLQRAIEQYRQGFELQPNDIYAGYNAVTLSSMLRNQDVRRKEVDELLPRVKRVLQQRRDTGEKSYSLESAAIELSVIERQWEEARSHAVQANELKPTAWQRAASMESLERLGSGLAPGEQHNLSEIISALGAADVDEDEEDPDA